MDARPTPVPGEGENLLAIGIPRFLPGARYWAHPEGYARIMLDPGPAPRELGRTLVLDVESLGFLGRPLFLIGAIFVDDEPRAAQPASPEMDAGAQTERLAQDASTRMVLYLARDYSEEEAVVRAFVAEAGPFPVWVTFNGKAFDLPFLELRAAYHRIPFPRPARHLDLLPVARRLWGEQLPNCRLQTLERYVCGRRVRAGDIGGEEIPRAYHDYVRTGEPWEMMRILHHNASDLATLLQLLRAARAQGWRAEDAD